jgi:hypothetical protein
MKKKFLWLIFLILADVFLAINSFGDSLSPAESSESITSEYEKKAIELNDARFAAINVGAEELVPDFLLEADNAFDDADYKYQANDYDGARASAADALTMYFALKDGIDAYNIREELAEIAGELVPDYLLTVDTIGLDAIDKWDAKDYPGAKAGADAALSMYTTLKDGIIAYIVREEIEEIAEELVPDYLLTVDNIGLDAMDKWEAKDYDGAKAGADAALSMYITLRDGIEAYNLRQEIAERAKELVPDVLLEVDTVGLDAIAKWEAGDYSGAKLGAAEALTMFSGLKVARDVYDLREGIAERAEVLYPDFLSLADDVALSAIDRWEAEDYSGAKDAASIAWIMYLSVAAPVERQAALDLKADMAARREFNTADAILYQANAAYMGQEYEKAALLYGESLLVYRMASQMVPEKRQAAEEALRRADQKVAESDTAARNAETVLQGGLK